MLLFSIEILSFVESLESEHVKRSGLVRIRVHVTPRRGVLDPQGQAVAHGLSNLGFAGVGEVRVGKVIDLELNAELSRDEALSQGKEMASKLLANEVVEDFSVEVLD